MIVRFRLAYGNELTEEQAAVLRRHVRDPSSVDPSKKWQSYEGDAFAVLRECPSLKLLIESGELAVTTFEAVIEHLQRIESLLTVRGAANGQHFNERVNVHVPGLGLLLMNEVTCVTDACTDDIEHYIEKGWRILAICPQPDKRRPDYILGRQKEEN